tara:strand:- start:236 stop:538 length:303 start_codon:yes stop_codon:yes gene_type:complete
MLKKPLLIFIVFSSVLTFLFFFFPINLFDGKIVVENGLQSYTADDNLSLSNFIGIGIEGMNEQGIVDFYLTAKGVILAFIYILGFPGLLAYRIYLKNQRL